MIYIFCALYQEASCLIEKYGLKRAEGFRSRVYQSGEITLAVTGTGIVGPVMALSEICQNHKKKESKDFMINLGIAGCRPDAKEDGRGKIFIANKIHNEVTGRDFYPDMIVNSTLPEKKLITVARPIDAGEMEEGILYDMEAAFLFEAGQNYFDVARMFFIKIISDAGVSKEQDQPISSEEVKMLVFDQMENIQSVMDVLRALSLTQRDSCEEQDKLTAAMSELLCASATMEQEIAKIIRYTRLARVDVEKILGDLKREGRIPVSDRREGKKVLDRIKRQILRFDT